MKFILKLFLYAIISLVILAIIVACIAGLGMPGVNLISFACPGFTGILIALAAANR